MTPDSSGRALLLAIGEAGTGRVTDGCAYCSYWAPSITSLSTEAGRNWGTAQPSLFLSPFLLPTLAQRGAAWDLWEMGHTGLQNALPQPGAVPDGIREAQNPERFGLDGC